MAMAQIPLSSGLDDEPFQHNDPYELKVLAVF